MKIILSANRRDTSDGGWSGCDLALEVSRINSGRPMVRLSDWSREYSVDAEELFRAVKAAWEIVRPEPVT